MAPSPPAPRWRWSAVVANGVLLVVADRNLLQHKSSPVCLTQVKSDVFLLKESMNERIRGNYEASKILFTPSFFVSVDFYLIHFSVKYLMQLQTLWFLDFISVLEMVFRFFYLESNLLKTQFSSDRSNQLLEFSVCRLTFSLNDRSKVLLRRRLPKSQKLL